MSFIITFKVVWGTLGAYAGIIFLYKTLKSSPKPEALEAEEQAFVDSYIKKRQEDLKIPRWIRGERDVFVGGH
jgi:hypothetical protein